MRYEKIFLIGNPIAGGGAVEKIKKASEILKEQRIPFEILLTKKRGDGEIFAREIVEKYGNRKVIVLGAGGDGTYNEIVNGLVHSQVPLAILPMGTTSVLAKELKIPKDMKKAVDLAIKGRVDRIHLAKIKNKEKQRFFILMAGVGFDGKAVYNVDLKQKRYLRKIAYIISGIKTLLKYKPKELKLTDGVRKKGYNAVICKASCYGGNFKIAPDADLRKPELWIFLSKTESRVGLMMQILAVILGKHLGMKKVEYLRAENLKISGDAHVQIDGDYFGKAPVEIKVIKNALNLVFPE